MKKLSLVVAAVVMAVGLAVSGDASAEHSSHEILSEGKILLSSASPKGPSLHYFSVAHDGKVYVCLTSYRDEMVRCDYARETSPRH
jgi:hypothetical protein